MTITINVPPEKEARLKRRAARCGQDLEGFLHDLFMREADQEDCLELPQEQQSLAEMLHGRIGLFEADTHYSEFVP